MAPTEASDATITLTKAQAAAIRAGLLTVDGFKPNWTEVGKAMGLGAPRNGSAKCLLIRTKC